MLADDVALFLDCEEETVCDMSGWTIECLGFDVRQKLIQNYEGHTIRFTKHLYDTVNMWYKLSCQQRLSNQAKKVIASVSDGVIDYSFKNEGHAPSEDYMMSLFKKAVMEEVAYFKKNNVSYATLLSCQFLLRALTAHVDLIEETTEYHLLKGIGYQMSEKRLFELWML